MEITVLKTWQKGMTEFFRIHVHVHQMKLEMMNFGNIGMDMKSGLFS